MYVFSFCKLMRINVFLFSQHGIRAIKEFENTRVRVSPCGQFRQPIQRPSHTLVVLQYSRSLVEAKPSSEHLAAGNFYQRDFPTTSIIVDEHTNRSASLRSTFRWKPRRKIAPISGSTLQFTRRRVAACETLFVHALPLACVSSANKPIHPLHAPTVAGKALLFHFFSPATVSAFFCRLNLHCFCVF